MQLLARITFDPPLDKPPHEGEGANPYRLYLDLEIGWQGRIAMIKLYGEMVADNKMKVTMISWSGNKPGGVEVEEVLEGEGIPLCRPLNRKAMV